MLKNYLVIAFRNLSKSIAHVSTNVIGLGIGIGMCIMAFLLTAFNTEYNKYYDKDITEDIYRLEYSNIENDEIIYYAGLQNGYTYFLDQDIPGIESVLRLFVRRSTVKSGDNRFIESLNFCNKAFVNAFSYNLVAGSYSDFDEPDALYISEEISAKYFGDESAIGKIMEINVKDTEAGIQHFKIKGVFENGKPNSSFGYIDMITNFDNLFRAYQIDKLKIGSGTVPIATTFIKVDNPQVLTNPTLLAKLDEAAHRMDENGNVKFRFSPFSEIHRNLRNQIRNTNSNTEIQGSVILTFNLMSIMILLIACFNYTMYAFSASGKRLKEIGVRKVSGGNRKQIMFQFLSESMVLSLLSLLVGVLFAQIIIPVFDSFFNGFPYALSDVNPFRLIVYLICITIFMAFMAGFYPALYVSRFDPSAILAKNAKLKRTGWITYSLLILQQVITIVGLGATFIFTDNIHWQENMDFGYDKDNLLTIQGLNSSEKSDVFIDFVKQHPKIISSGLSWKMIGNGTGDRKVSIQGEEYYVDLLETGPNYLETHKVRLVDGRFWYNESETDMISSALVNKQFLETTNITDPLNKKISLPNGQVVNIIGVIDNYKHVGPWQKSEPTVIHYPLEREFKFLAIRGGSMEDLKEIDDYCKEYWEKLEPFIPYTSMYESGAISGGINNSISFKKTFLLTAVFALLLSIGGMFSLISMLLQKKTKEIAIRKSIGSNTNSLLFLISKPYLIVTLVASIIGGIAGIYLVKALLDDMYDYHVKVNILWYVLAGFIMLSITVITLSAQTVRAASVNPTKGLRYE